MFGFGKKTWKDEREWLNKASELLQGILKKYEK